MSDLIAEAEKDIRGCLEAGATSVQIDFTEGRLAIKLDPSLKLLEQFIDLNNRVLERFSDAERLRIGVHSCPGGDHDYTHSADIAYDDLLPRLFQLRERTFYIQLASEKNRQRVLDLVRANLGFEAAHIRGRDRSDQPAFGDGGRSMFACVGSRQIRTNLSAWNNGGLGLLAVSRLRFDFP